MNDNPLGILFAEDKKESITDVVKVLTAKPCLDCRLGFRHPTNKGVVVRGVYTARIVGISEAPGPSEMESGKAFSAQAGEELDKWMAYLKIDTNKDMLLTNVVQCNPPSGGKEKKQRAPELDEINTCFNSRALRILKAMPNLEVIITFGWVAAKAILGGEPNTKSHEGNWYTSSLLPGIPVYCMVHPSFILRSTTPTEKENRSGRIVECLDQFKREYLDSNKVIKLAKGV
jgi:uracil-DNA glycosylase